MRRFLDLGEGMIMNEKGGAAVEFALLAPVLMLLFTGAVEYGAFIQESTRIGTAARAGVQHSLHSHANAEDSATIAAIVRRELGDPADLTVAVEESNECPDGSVVAASQLCPGYGRPQVFLTVRAERPYRSLMLSYISPAGQTITREATVRIR